MALVATALPSVLSAQEKATTTTEEQTTTKKKKKKKKEVVAIADFTQGFSVRSGGRIAPEVRTPEQDSLEVAELTKHIDSLIIARGNLPTDDTTAMRSMQMSIDSLTLRREAIMPTVADTLPATDSLAGDSLPTAVYRCEDEELIPVVAQKACALDEILAELNGLQQPVVILGDGADAYKAQIQAGLTADYHFAALHQSRQRAGSLAVLALQKAKNGQLMPGAELVPEYLRLSQAERERLEKEQQ